MLVIHKFENNLRIQELIAKLSYFLCRSFVPPTRDEESETQRKAHAKRVRETRRSTQGVTLDEIKSAEQLVKMKNANNNNNSGNVSQKLSFSFSFALKNILSLNCFEIFF